MHAVHRDKHRGSRAAALGTLRGEGVRGRDQEDAGTGVETTGKTAADKVNLTDSSSLFIWDM